MRRRRVRWLNMNIYAGPVAVVVMITYGHFHLPLGILLWEAHCTILLKRFLERRAFIPCQFQIETAVRQISHYSYKRLMASKNMTKYCSLKNIWQSSLITFDLANMSKGTKEISYLISLGADSVKSVVVKKLHVSTIFFTITILKVEKQCY